MITNYKDFIFERFYPHSFTMTWEDLMNIYKNEIVPKIGEITNYESNLPLQQTLDNVLDRQTMVRFDQLVTKILDYRKEFATTLIDLDRFYNTSYSNLASKKGNPESDFEELQNLLNKAGFSLEILKKLFDPDLSILIKSKFKSFIRTNHLDEKNGYIDIYLYKLNEKLNLSTTVYLGGEGWADAVSDYPDDEYIVKYSYGYHKTQYGQLFLRQLGMSTEVFLERAYSYLKKYLHIEVFGFILMKLKKESDQIGRHIMSNDIDIDTYVTLDDDRFIIRYYDFYEDFQKKFNIENFGVEWFKNSILNRMKIIPHLEIVDTGEVLIFHD